MGPVVEVACAEAAAPRPVQSVWLSLAIVAAIFTGNGAQALVFDGLPPILPQIAAHFGGGKAGELMAQLVSTAPILGVMIAGLFSGLTVERLGVRASLLIGLLVFAVAGSAGFVIEQAHTLLLSRLVMGLAVGLMTTACASLVALRYSGDERARMNGYLVSVGSLTGLAWLLISGHLATLFSWRAPFLLHGLWALLLLAPVLLIGVVRPPRPESRALLAGLGRLKPVAPIYLLAGGSFLVVTMFNVQLSFIMASIGVASPAQQSHVFSLTPVGVASASLAYGWIEARVGWIRLMKVSYLLVGGALILVAFGADAGTMTVAAAVDGVGLGLMLPSLWMLAMQRAPEDMMPRALGLMTTALFLGATVNPIVLAPVRALVGVRGQFIVAGGLFLGGLLMHEVVRRWRSAVAVRPL